MVARARIDTFHRHRAWYNTLIIYLLPLSVGAGPWLYFGFRTVLRGRLYDPRRLSEHLRRGGKSSLLLCWFLLPLAIFALARSKLELYVLPLYVPVVLATARGLCKNGDIARHLGKAVRIAVAAGCVLIAVKGVAAYIPNRKNMKPVYEMCRAMDGHGTEFLAFEEPKLFGLQFYLNGHLQRVSVSGKEPWADHSLEESLRKIQGSRSSASYVFISSRQNAPILHQALGRRGLPCKRLEDRYWILCSLPGGRLLQEGEIGLGESTNGKTSGSLGWHPI